MPRCLECGATDARWLKVSRVWECRHCGHQQPDPVAPAMADMGEADTDDAEQGDPGDDRRLS